MTMNRTHIQFNHCLWCLKWWMSSYILSLHMRKQLLTLLFYFYSLYYDDDENNDDDACHHHSYNCYLIEGVVVAWVYPILLDVMHDIYDLATLHSFWLSGYKSTSCELQGQTARAVACCRSRGGVWVARTSLLEGKQRSLYMDGDINGWMDGVIDGWMVTLIDGWMVILIDWLWHRSMDGWIMTSIWIINGWIDWRTDSTVRHKTAIIILPCCTLEMMMCIPSSALN